MKKINKYKDLAAEMLVKQKEAEVKTQNRSILSRVGFGFPERKNTTVPNISAVRQVQPKFKNANRNSLPEPVQDNSGLTTKNIKCCFDDIVGMKDVKEMLYEAVIIPQKRPDLF